MAHGNQITARMQAYNIQPGAVDDQGVKQSEIWQFTAVYVAPSDLGNPNLAWSKATPSASLIMYVTNPDVFGKIQNGKQYHMTLEEL